MGQIDGMKKVLFVDYGLYFEAESGPINRKFYISDAPCSYRGWPKENTNNIPKEEGRIGDYLIEIFGCYQYYLNLKE